MKLSEYLKQNGMTSKEYFDMQKRRASGKTTLTDYRRNQASSLKSKIDFDTFKSDLETIGSTVEDIYKGWQSQETMTNTRSTVESMKERVNAFQEYQKLFGGEDAVDISDLANSYNTVLNDWDSLTETYGQYQNADAFNVVKKNTELEKKFSHEDGSGYTFEEVQEALKKYSPDSDEYKYLSTYTNYSDLNDFNKAIEHYKTAGVKEGHDALEKKDGLEMAADLNSPYVQVPDLSDATNKVQDKDYYEELQRKKNLRELEHKIDLYKPEYEGKEDFEENSKYVTTYNEDKKPNALELPLKYEDLTYEYINNVDGARDKIQKEDEAINRDGNGYQSKWQKAGYDLLHEDEIAIYNYKYKVEGKESAEEFLEDMQTVLDKRRTGEYSEYWEKNAEELPILSSAATVIMKPAGAIAGAIDDAWNAAQGKEYNPYSYAHTISNYVSDTREYVGENIAENTEGFELFGQNIPSFLYNTGMSIADSAYGVATAGKFSSVLMGTSAFQDKAKEMVEAGESQDVIWKSAITSGVAEMLFEHIGIDNLFNIKSVDSLGGIVKSALKQAGAEGLEEVGTEITNIIADDVIRGKNSELYKTYSDLIARGYTEKEALTKTALQAGSQVAWAGIGGALSGTAMGGVAGVNNYAGNKIQGQTIRGNERVGDMLNIASMTPQESDAYKAYTEYANKNINADNITDAQLGNLYGMAKNDAVSTLKSKKATEGQKGIALKTLHGLKEVDTANESAKKAKELTKDLKTGETTEVAETGKTVSIKGIKIDTNEVITSEGETLSENDVTFSERDKELLGYAKQMDETTANLLFELDDGQTDVSQYLNSFNLSMAYAKNDFSQDYILEHRGVLSTAQVNSIYKTTVLNPRKAQQKRLNDLVQEQGDNLEIKGTIDDSVIDYDNTGAEGKVNWDSLHANVKSTIAFITGFSTKVAGMDVQLVTNGADYGFTGQYDRQGNKMLIDINALSNRVKSADTKGRKDNARYVISTVAHEVTHWMEDKAKELYAQYDKMVMDALTSGGMTEEEVLGRRRLRMEKAEAKRAAKENRKPREITDKEVRREVIARASEDMLALSEEGKKFFESMTESEQKQFVDKIQEVIQNIKDWIKTVLSKLTSSAPEAKELRALAKDLDAISKKWDEMLRQSAKVNAAMKKAGINDNAIMESEVESETQNADIDSKDKKSKSSKRVAARKKSGYNEFKTLAMIWAHKTTRKSGDGNIIYDGRRGKYILIEALEEGYFEVAAGTLGEMEALYERVHGKEDRGIHADINEARFRPRTGVWDMQLSQNRGHDAGDVRQTGGEELQDDSTRGNEHLRQGNQGKSINNSYSDIDTDYFDAIERGDMETVQKMVNEAARKAGYTIKGFHGSFSFFTKFGKGNKTSQAPDGAYFFTSNKDVAYSYTGYKNDVNLDITSYPVYEQLTRDGNIEKNRLPKGGVYNVSLKIKNPYVVDFGGEYYSHKVNGMDINETVRYAKENGYDGVIAKNIKDPGDMGDANWENENSRVVADDYIVFDSTQIKSTDPVTYDDNGNLIPLSKRFDASNEDIRYSDIDDDIQTAINQSMTMAQAKDMIQRAFVMNNLKAWYDDQYKDGDEWLAGEGANEVATYIENTYEVYEKYIGAKYQGIVDGDWFVEDIVDAYVNKTLTGKVKEKTQWMDLSSGVVVADKRFYAPREIKNAKKKLEVAKQRITNSNRAKVTKARAEILLYAHNKGAAETLGLTESELKKMLRQWGGYSASAREISMRFNNNVANSNRWVGIENCSWLKSAQVSEKELSRLVNSVEGDSHGFERNYIARTMLALDTHIDWSEIKFVFTGVVDPNRRSVRGLYDNRTRTITASYGSINTVAHEMGHALDYKWARDLGFDGNAFLTDRYLRANQIKTEEQKLWYSHFKDFVSSITDKADLTSEYTMRDQEVFARFVASFVEWVDKTATGRVSYGYTGFKDKFTGSDYVSFVKLLQEKAMLDSKSMVAEKDVQYSDIDTEYMDAVNSGDMKTVKQMVQAAAKAAGYNIEGFHGTKAKDFYIFEKGDIGFHFGTAEQAKTKSTTKVPKNSAWVDYQDTGGRTINAYLKMENPLTFSRDLGEWTVPELTWYFKSLLDGEKTISIGKFNREDQTMEYEEVAPRTISNISITEEDRASIEGIEKQYMRDGISHVGESVKDWLYSSRSHQELRNFLKKKGYDSIKYLNEYEGKENAYSYAVFDAEQIKSADPITYDNDGNVIPLSQRFNLDNKDIRYSDIDDEVDIYEVLGENKRLQKENQKLHEDFDRLVERLKLEKQVTGGTTFNRNQLDAVAAHIRNLANSDYSKTELVKQLNDVYTYIITSKELTWDDLYARLHGISQAVLEESRLKKVEDNDYFKTVLKEIRNTEISLSDVQKKDLESAYGTSWNRAVFGKLKVSNDAIMDLDSQWKAWSETYPGLFDAETTEGDQIIKLLELYDDLKDGSEVYEDLNNEDNIRWLANEIYNQYWRVSTIKTTADKYDKQIKELNWKHREAMKELRDKHDARLEKQKQADKSKYEEIIKNIRQRKEKEIQEVRKLGKERMDKYREEAKRKTLMQSIRSTTTSLNKKLVTNSKDVHIPEPLKPVVINLIASLDFSSRRLLGLWGGENKGTPTQRDIALEKTFSKVRSMADENISIKDAVIDVRQMFTEGNKIFSTVENANDLSLAMLDLDLVDKIDDLIKSIDVLEKKFGDNGFVLEKMSIDDLNTLNAMVKSINHWATQVDKALAIKHKEGIANLGMQTIEENDDLGEYTERVETVEGLKKFFSWSNLLPVNAFERMGNAAKKVFESLQDAQDKLVFNQDEVERFTAELFNGKEKEIAKWREDVRTFDLDMPNGKKKTVKMPVSYMMSLYAIAKQEDAMRHLLGVDQEGNKIDGGGFTIKGFKTKGHVESDRKNTLLTKELIAKITGELSEEQKHIANELQKFMNEKGSAWGDSVSMALYGIKKFGVENYFPITVTPTTIKKLNTDKKNTTNFFSILNFGFTKSRNPNAKQSIEIGDIFDVFTNHMTMMAIYNAYALPVFDMVRWYNYHSKTIDGEEIGVINSLQNAFGEGATSYIEKLITDLNGQHESSRLGFINRIFKNTKVAMVGNSLSVAALQPMAYPKAALVISPKYLMKSLFYIKDFGVKKGREKAKKYSGIALWKSKGNFDVDISRNVSTRIMHNETWRDKLIDWSLKGAEKGDEFTWGMLWNACEFEIRDTRKDLKVGSDEFYEAIAKRLREIVYKTQVVDSPLTRSEIMRSPDGMAKSLTMFASELTVAYNIVSEAFVDAHLDVRKNGKKGAMKRNGGKIARAMTIYTVTSAVSQILTTAMQAFRDDDDEKEFEDYLKMYLSNFALDWLIIGKLPYIKEALNYAQGYSSSRVETVWMDSAFKAAKYWGKAFSGDGEGAARKAIENSLKTISYLSGVAGYNQYRDLMATLDSLGIIEKEEFEEWLDDIFG